MLTHFPISLKSKFPSNPPMNAASVINILARGGCTSIKNFCLIYLAAKPPKCTSSNLLSALPSNRDSELTYTTLSGQEIFQNLTRAPKPVMPPRIYHSLFFNPPIVPALKLEFLLFPPNALGGEPSRSRSRVSASDSTLSLVASGGSGAERG